MSTELSAPSAGGGLNAVFLVILVRIDPAGARGRGGILLAAAPTPDTGQQGNGRAVTALPEEMSGLTTVESVGEALLVRPAAAAVAAVALDVCPPVLLPELPPI